MTDKIAGLKTLVHGYRGVTYLDNDGVKQNPTVRLTVRDAEKQVEEVL